MILSLPQTQGQHRAGCCLPRGFGATSCFPLFQLLPPVLRIKLNISQNQETNSMRAGFQPNLRDVMECDGNIFHFVKSWVIEVEQGCLLLWRQEFEPLEDFSDLKILLSTFIKHIFSLSIQLENLFPILCHE